jgi:hypothetical protein
MKIEFEDGSFLQLNDCGECLELVQCAKKDRTLILSSTRLSKTQIQELITFMSKWKGSGDGQVG